MLFKEDKVKGNKHINIRYIFKTPTSSVTILSAPLLDNLQQDEKLF